MAHAAVKGFLLVATLLLLTGCTSHRSVGAEPIDSEQTILTVMSLVDGADADFETKALNSFAARRGKLQIRYIPSFESDDQRLAMYKQLFKERSPQPDICQVDIIWPGMIGDDLLDLTPYFRDELQAFPEELLKSFTVHGRLVAMPLFVDSGVLYYRSDLLHRYGFKNAPGTWDELERMAQVIQRGERRKDPNFWGYLWQGGATEALTCNALEWQASEGGGHILEPNGTPSVCNPQAIRALDRAVSWIGKISPPGVTTHTEDDSINLYSAGHAAFMRNWSSFYGTVHALSCPVRKQTAVALLPAGRDSRGRALGGIAVGVSKYSEHRNEAIAAVRDLVSEASQITRVMEGGSAPTRLALQQRPDLMRQTAFHGPVLTGQILNGLVARPSVTAGSAYDEVSKAYYSAVHSALAKQFPASVALATLQLELARIMKTKAAR
jgi:trehalose/maltose transport system substrate-binding protein